MYRSVPRQPSAYFHALSFPVVDHSYHPTSDPIALSIRKPTVPPKIMPMRAVDLAAFTFP